MRALGFRLAALVALAHSACTTPPSRTEAPRAPSVPAPGAGPRVITVEGTSEADIQRALDRAAAGAVVQVPAGRYAIAGVLTIRGDDVVLRGAGAGSLAFDSTAGSGDTVFVRATDEGEHIRPMLRATGGKRVRVSAIRFEGVSSPGSKGKDVGVLLEDVQDFRVDHAYFAHMGFAGVRTNGTSRGVVDHSTFFAEYKPAIGTEGYGVVVYGTNALTGVPFGAPQLEATFIEDCEFSLSRHAVSANKGARYVFRHNHVVDGVVAHAIDAHGTEYASEIGTEWIDVYDNLVEQANHGPPYYDGWAVRIRGGKGLVWNNTFRGYHTGVELTQLTSEATGPVFVWGNTLEPSAAGAMVHTGRSGQLGTPSFTEAAPPGYTPHPYPHPLVGESP